MTIAAVPAGISAAETKRIIDDARHQAARLKNRIRYEGADPMGVRHDERAAPTVADLCDRYIADYLPRKRPASQRDDRAIIDRIVLPELGARRVAELRFSDIDGLHRKLSKSAPVRANRVVALLSKMLNLAVKWDWRSDNPAKGVEKNSEQPRQRYLSGTELKSLTVALNEHPDQQAANIIRLLLLTGARRGEVQSAEWKQFDLSAGVWTKPSSHTKQRREHRIPLSAPATQLLVTLRQEADAELRKLERARAQTRPSDSDRLDEVRRRINRFVFPARSGNAGHRIEIKAQWAELCKAAGLMERRKIGEGGETKIVEVHSTRIHDLRHTHASLLASAGMSLPVIGALLGHTQPATTARYAHLLDDPLRRATERVAATLQATTGKRAAVVPLRRRK